MLSLDTPQRRQLHDLALVCHLCGTQAWPEACPIVPPVHNSTAALLHPLQYLVCQPASSPQALVLDCLGLLTVPPRHQGRPRLLSCSAAASWRCPGCTRGRSGSCCHSCRPLGLHSVPCLGQPGWHQQGCRRLWCRSCLLCSAWRGDEGPRAGCCSCTPETLRCGEMLAAYSKDINTMEGFKSSPTHVRMVVESAFQLHLEGRVRASAPARTSYREVKMKHDQNE